MIKAADPRCTTTVLVDMSSEAVLEATRYGHSAHCSRIEDFETASRFDFVLLLNLIEHVASPAAVLRKLASVIRPGGLILLKTPNWRSLDERIFRRRSWAGYHCPRHWVLFTRESLAGLAESCGFRVRVQWYTQGAPFWAATILGNLAARGWIRASRQHPPVSHPLFMPLMGLFAGLDFVRGMAMPTSQMFFVLERQ